jgi:two-component system LytT family response regulator
VGAPVRIRAIIADDEPAGRRALHLLLLRDPEVEIAAECRTGAEAADAIIAHRPDIAFLDVQMPGGDGFEAIAEVPPAFLPLIVIVTAFEKYSLRAFDVHAVDYLLKPFSDRRFRATLMHLKQRLEERAAGEAARFDAARRQRELGGRDAAVTPAGAAGRLAVRSHAGTVLLDVAEIDWVEARGDYIRIHSKRGAHLVREAIGMLERALPTASFVRVHRSAIVNLAAVREIVTAPSGAATVRLHDGTTCRVSQAGRSRLAEALGGRL